jgi:hypothetical protein
MNTEQGHKVSRPLKTVHMSQVELLSHDLIHAPCGCVNISKKRLLGSWSRGDGRVRCQLAAAGGGV